MGNKLFDYLDGVDVKNLYDEGFDKRSKLVDYTNEIDFKNLNYRVFKTIYAQGLGTDVLILSELETPFRRMDGTIAHYVLEYREVNAPCIDCKDGAYTNIVVVKRTYHQLSDLQRYGVLGLRGEKFDGINLFRCFSIC